MCKQRTYKEQIAGGKDRDAERNNSKMGMQGALAIKTHVIL